jgi:hypothetical protein
MAGDRAACRTAITRAPPSASNSCDRRSLGSLAAVQKFLYPKALCVGRFAKTGIPHGPSFSAGRVLRLAKASHPSWEVCGAPALKEGP